MQMLLKFGDIVEFYSLVDGVIQTAQSYGTSNRSTKERFSFGKFMLFIPGK
jgi:hypothetical protein